MRCKEIRIRYPEVDSESHAGRQGGGWCVQGEIEQLVPGRLKGLRARPNAHGSVPNDPQPVLEPDRERDGGHRRAAIRRDSGAPPCTSCTTVATGYNHQRTGVGRASRGHRKRPLPLM